MLSRISNRRFSTILPTGEKVERELSLTERELVNLKQKEFSKLGLYRKKVTNEASLFKLFQMAQPRSKTDYSACLYAMNHFYNFGVSMEHHDLTNRWLSLAVESGRVDEAVQIVKLWNTWLPAPPNIKLVNILIQMVKIEQSRDLLKTIRECWQLPLSPSAYTCVIAKELASRSNSCSGVLEAYIVWKDAIHMDVVLSENITHSLWTSLRDIGESKKAHEVENVMIRQSIGGIQLTE